MLADYQTNITVLALDTTAPTWPAGSSLTASNVGQTSLALTWTAATDNEGVTGYRVYRGSTLVDTVGGTVRTYAVSGLNPGTQYTFKVEAGDAAGNWSTTGPSVTMTTAPSPPHASRQTHAYGHASPHSNPLPTTDSGARGPDYARGTPGRRPGDSPPHGTLYGQVA